MLWLCFQGMGQLAAGNRLQKALLLLLAVCFCGASAKCLVLARDSAYNPVVLRGDRVNLRFAQLETYALEHPDQLLIADNAFSLDWTLFPDWREGKATNILYAWGGWNNHSAGYRAVMRQFGLAHDHFTVLDFCRKNVRLVTGGDAPPAPLMDYLLEQSQGKAVAEKTYTGEGFTLYAFHVADESGQAPLTAAMPQVGKP